MFPGFPTRLLTLAALALALGLGGAWPGPAAGQGRSAGGDRGPSTPPGMGGGWGSAGGMIAGGGLRPMGGGSSLPQANAGGVSVPQDRAGRRDLPGPARDDGGPGSHSQDAAAGSSQDAAGRRPGAGGEPRKDAARDEREANDKASRPGGQGDDKAVSAHMRARQQQATALLERHRDVVEPDDAGRPVVRGEILALSPSAAALARAHRAGFRIRSAETIPGLGVRSVVLTGPPGLSVVEALRRLRGLDPQGQYDFNHLYQESGAVGARRAGPAPAAASASTDSARGVRVGLVDGGVAQAQPALGGARIIQRSFAPGGLRPCAHATAVASLLAGREGRFRGAAPGATVYVADVYGSTAAGGSAQAIARALGWLAQEGAPVINISLVGPPNLLLQSAVRALLDRGHLIVAAVGNDGPAAPPLYPAAYSGVVAVTGVDAQRRVLPEAGRGTHVDFAAPGADMAAAGLDGGFVAVRGTSFAAPLAAGLLARRLTAPSREAAGRALAALSAQAVDLGPQGPDPIYGRGLVAVELRTAPALVQAKLALRDP